uniref:Uncharacterized protein n=1 Tax=Bacillus amyloliquefaciens TaxID=1390 RepID=Q9F0N7_BACAM|nr:unknown [Bacillus amyloliquefaciens]
MAQVINTFDKGAMPILKVVYPCSCAQRNRRMKSASMIPFGAFFR